MKIRANKIGSVVHRLGLGAEIEISRMVDARVGQVLVVRALGEKAVYDVLELTSGRLAHIGKGDVIVGALGRRDALRGFVGHVPDSIKAGDTLNVLNLGGVLGVVTSGTREVGPPLQVEVLGMAVRNGRGLNIADAALGTGPEAQQPERSSDATPRQIPPVVVVSGTCMNAGKTYAASEIIARLTQRGYACGGIKLTGVAALRDTLNMADHGAVATASFVDCGIPSTAGYDDMPSIGRQLLHSLGADTNTELDVIVAELGDGLIGSYGVDALLGDDEFRSAIKAHVLCASDLVAAWGGIGWMKEQGLAVDLIAGPATDNEVGVEHIRNGMGVPAINARLDPNALVDLVEKVAFSGAGPAAASAATQATANSPTDNTSKTSHDVSADGASA